MIKIRRMVEILVLLISILVISIQASLAEEYHIYGEEPFIFLSNSSVLYAYPGSSISHLNCYDNSSVIIYGGEISHLTMNNNSQVTINYAEDIGHFYLHDQSKADIHNIKDLSWLVTSNDSVANVYGSAFNYDSGHLSGIWENGISFNFWALKGQGYGKPPLSPSDTMPNNIIFHYPPPPPLPDFIMTPIYEILLSE